MKTISLVGFYASMALSAIYWVYVLRKASGRRNASTGNVPPGNPGNAEDARHAELQAGLSSAESSFAFWDNEEDAEYDNL